MWRDYSRDSDSRSPAGEFVGYAGILLILLSGLLPWKHKTGGIPPMDSLPSPPFAVTVAVALVLFVLFTLGDHGQDAALLVLAGIGTLAVAILLGFGTTAGSELYVAGIGAYSALTGGLFVAFAGLARRSSSANGTPRKSG